MSEPKTLADKATDAVRKKFDPHGSVWFWIYEKVGLPTLLLAIVLYAGARVVEWAEPRINKVVDRHLKFVDTSAQTQSESLKLQEQNKSIHQDQAEILERLTKTQVDGTIIGDEHRRLTLEIRDDVKDIKDVIVPKGTR